MCRSVAWLIGASLSRPYASVHPRIETNRRVVMCGATTYWSMRPPIRAFKSLLSHLVFAKRILVTWPIRVDVFFCAKGRMIPGWAALSNPRNFLMTITADGIRVLQQNTLRVWCLGILSQGMAASSPCADEEQCRQ